MPRVRTKIPEFLRKEGLTSDDLETASGTNRKTMTKYKRDGNLRLTSMLRILCGARRLTARRVVMDELWELDPSAEECAALVAVPDAEDA